MMIADHGLEANPLV